MTQVYPVVSALCGDGFPTDVVCQVLAVSRSAYYAFRTGNPSEHRVEDQRLKPLVSEVFWENKKRYGARRIVKAFASMGVTCSVRRVARLMAEMELVAIQPKSFRPRTTDSRHLLGYSPNLLLDAEEPQTINRLWVGDITYIPLENGRFAYAALVMDRFSRRIIGWDIQLHMRESLVCGALENAISARERKTDLILHTDRGGQYAGKKFRSILSRIQANQSMSRAANCYDNAFMESCFGTLKTELEMDRYRNVEITRKEIGSYIRYYNTRRLHSSLGYSTPIEFEQRPLS